jgi:hypothetical protein
VSMFTVTCERCGQTYRTGMVGTTFYGAHSCHGTSDPADKTSGETAPDYEIAAPLEEESDRRDTTR